MNFRLYLFNLNKLLPILSHYFCLLFHAVLVYSASRGVTMDFWNSFKSFFKERVWGQTFPRLVFLGIVGFLGFTTLKGCFFPPPGVMERVYRIARDPAWAGLTIRGRESNLLGFSDRLLDDIARKKGFRIEFYASPTNNLVQGLHDDIFDAIFIDMPPTISNKEKFIFSEPFYPLGPVLVVDSNATQEHLEDFAGKTIGIYRNSNLLIQGRIPKNILVYPYDSINVAIDDLIRDRIDAVIMDFFYAYALQSGFYSGKIKVIPHVLTNEALRLVAMKNDHMEPLIEAFNQGLKLDKTDGTYYNLLKNFNLPNIEPEEGIPVEQPTISE